jgi:uncharacterized membrane protein
MKEQHYRSFVKGVTWRIWATGDTILLSWWFTGSITSALKIGVVEVFTKIFLYYVHERIWMKLGWWRNREVLPDGSVVRTDKHYRSVIKGTSYRFFGTIDTVIIAFFVTHNYGQAFHIGFVEVFTKIGLYYLHERLWHKISFGTIQTSVEPAAAEVKSPPAPPRHLISSSSFEGSGGKGL